MQLKVYKLCSLNAKSFTSLADEFETPRALEILTVIPNSLRPKYKPYEYLPYEYHNLTCNPTLPSISISFFKWASDVILQKYL